MCSPAPLPPPPTIGRLKPKLPSGLSSDNLSPASLPASMPVRPSRSSDVQLSGILQYGGGDWGGDSLPSPPPESRPGSEGDAAPARAGESVEEVDEDDCDLPERRPTCLHNWSRSTNWSASTAAGLSNGIDPLVQTRLGMVPLPGIDVMSQPGLDEDNTRR